MIRIERVWDHARRDRLEEMRAEVTQMTDRELETAAEAAHQVMRAAVGRLEQIDQERVKARLARYGNTNGLRFRRRPPER